MKKNQTVCRAILAVLFVTLAAGAMRAQVEIDGLWYRAYSNYLTLTYPQGNSSLVYEMDEVTIPGSAIYNGVEMPVKNVEGMRKSQIKHITIGKRSDYLERFDFIENMALERLDIENFPERANNDHGGGQVCVSKSCADVTVQRFPSKGKIVLHLEKFNVYGPDGQKPVPYLTDWEPGYTGKNIKLYFDENGNIELDDRGYYRLGDEDVYVHVLPNMSSYCLVLLYFGEGENRMNLRLQVAHDNVGRFAEVDGLRYALAGEEAYLVAPAEGMYSGDVVVPAEILWQGEKIPVTRVWTGAFSGSDVTSITLSSNVTMEDVVGCPLLHTLDTRLCDNVRNNGFNQLRITSNPSLKNVLVADSQETRLSFYYCDGLEEVHIPAGVKDMWYFSSCKSLRKVNVPDGASYTDCRFVDTPALFRFPVKLINQMDGVYEYIFTMESGLVKDDGTPLDLVVAINKDNTNKLTHLIRPYTGKGTPTFPHGAYVVQPDYCTDRYGKKVDYFYVLPDSKEPVNTLVELAKVQLSQIAPSTTENGVDYMVNGKGATVYKGENAPEGDVVIADEVEIDGIKYPVTEVKSAALSYSNITSVTFGANVETMDAGISHCPDLQSIDMSAMKDVTIPGTATLAYYCPELREVKLPSQLTNMVQIGFCDALQEIDIPATVRTIDNVKLYKNPLLARVSIPEGCEIKTSPFLDTPALFAVEAATAASHMRAPGQYYTFRLRCGLEKADKSPLPVAIVGYMGGLDGITKFHTPDADGIFSIPVEDTKTSDGTDIKNVYIIYDPADGNYLSPVAKVGDFGLKSYLYEMPLSDLSVSSVVDIVGDSAEGTAQYYDLQGRKLADRPGQAGVYIVKRGGKVTKELVVD